MILRISASILLLFSILFMPFWVSVILAFASMIYFSKFFEATILFFLSDLLYGTKETKGFPIIFTSFIMDIIVLIIIETMKKKVKFYSSHDNKNN